MNLDVVIIGGGPAGCAAAITAARAGQTVALIERHSFPRHRPGETLAPGVEPLFRRLGVWEEIGRAGFIRHPGHWVIDSTGRRQFSRFGGAEAEPWLGMQAWRPTLDAILLRAAQSVGAIVWQPCRAISPITGNDRITGVITNRGKIGARCLIDATGRGEWLARKQNLPVQRRSPRLVATYGYIETENEEASRWFLPALETSACGWKWTAQVQPNIVAWTQLSFEGRPATVPEELSTLKGARRVQLNASRADVTWRFCARSAGPGWFIAGDAAVNLDPSSSHGVLRALMSGMMAGQLSAEICQRRAPEPAAIAHYDSWLRDWFERDAKSLQTLQIHSLARSR